MNPLNLVINYVKPYLFILILALCALAVVYHYLPSMETVQTALGMDTKENLKKKLEQSHQNVAVLEDANKANQVAASIVSAVIYNTQKAIEVKAKADAKDVKIVSKIKEDTEAKVKQIEVSNVSDDDKSEQISVERIGSVWKTYCSFNKDDKCPTDIPFVPIEVTSTNTEEGEIQ